MEDLFNLYKNKNLKDDYKNRLTKVENGSGTIVEYKYDVLGRRYEKKVGSETTNYVYSNENLLTEYKTNGSLTTKKEYINGLGTDNILAVDYEESILSLEDREELNFCNTNVLSNTGGFIKYGWDEIVSRCEELESSGSILTTNRYYYHKNHLGSVVGISDNSGNLVTEYEYDSYGNYEIVSGLDIGNDILYTGREYDREIGLYYFRARYYDSKLGRFISRDPIGQLDNVNLYAYVGNNPVMFVDPSGLGSKPAIGHSLEYNFKTPINDKFWGGAGLFAFGNATVQVFGGVCAESASITTGCVSGLSDKGPILLGCLGPAIVTGASCGATGIGMGASAAGGYMMSTSGNGNGLNNGTSGSTPNNPTTTENALDEMEKFLGPGYKDMGKGRFVSKDGMRQARIGDNDILGKHAGGPHINLEKLDSLGKVIRGSNIHLFFKD